MLARARDLGFLGPGPLDPHLVNAEAFASAASAVPERALDLGSGGGLPGLALALQWPSSRWVLLDAMHRRADFLRMTVEELELAERVTVHEDRAETAGRDVGLRGTFDLVTARSFGRPAVTAECGAPFLRLGGVLLVSEPPDAGERWSGCEELGLADQGVAEGATTHIRRLELLAPCPDRYPRRVGVPEKRRLW